MDLNSLELYQQYSREEVITLLSSQDMVTEFSSGEFVMSADIGVIFATIGKPPHETYCLTNNTLKWFTSESELGFYNSIMLSFPSRYRVSTKSLHLFAKCVDETLFLYLGTLHVIECNCPSRAGGSGFPSHVIVQFEIEPPLNVDIWSKFDGSKDQIFINGLPLPKTLMTSISQNKITTKHYRDGFLSLEPDKMHRETQQLHYLYNSGLGDAYALAELDNVPDKITLSKAVCIGDAEIDEPICLDYSNSLTDPRIVHLIWDKRSYWKQVAENFDQFVKQLNL